jgi:hypothetical protein
MDNDELFRRLRDNAPTEYPSASVALVTLGPAMIDWLPKPGVTTTSGFFVGRVELRQLPEHNGVGS